MVKTKNITGIWSEPILVKEGKGLIDPSPLWDDDDKAYLAYAYAGSRAGIKSLLAICSLNPEGTFANNYDDVLLIDGHDGEETIEGPKVYKQNGYYYVFAPAGGVPTGWQTVLRSKTIYLQIYGVFTMMKIVLFLYLSVSSTNNRNTICLKISIWNGGLNANSKKISLNHKI